MRKPRRSQALKAATGASDGEADTAGSPAKRPRAGGEDVFDRLPDDLILVVLSELAAAAASPADIAGISLTCRRFRELTSSPMVLSRASAAAVAVRAGSWCEAAHRFLRRCAGVGNLHACYLLGMVRFYCLGSKAAGAALLARAAAGGHAAALYALAVVYFNGSGGGKADKDPRAGVALCSGAAWLGHAPALRELGHCLQDGYGAGRDSAAGRRLLLYSAARELLSWTRDGRSNADDVASQFMVAWWQQKGAKEEANGARDDGEEVNLRLCSHALCGRRETRRHEFRRCSVCGSVNYCSRACQALDWKRAHRARCEATAAGWLAGDAP